MQFSRQEYWSGLPFPSQWATFCQNSPPRPVCLGWPYTAWLSFIDCSIKLKDAYSSEGSYGQPRQHIKKQRHYFPNKGPSTQGYGFPSSHVRMWELDWKESWAPKNWCIWTVVLEKTLENPLDCKEIQPVNPKGNRLWILIGRTDDEAEAPILWPRDAKSWLIGKDPDAGKD